MKKKLSALQYSLDTFHRSNQDTSLVHKPTVFEGDWVQPGDLLADCSASEGGELALGHNILVAYMPWEGYNFEDAILISEKLVYDDIFTSIHIERYETETRQTKLGAEKITRELPEVTSDEVKHLDSSGIAKIGSWVEEGDILVGKITPLPEKVQSPSQKFLYKLLDKKFKPIRDSSLRAPKSIKSKVIKIEVFSSAPMQLNPKGLEKHAYTSGESFKKKENKKNSSGLSFTSGRGKGKSKVMQYSIASLPLNSKTHLAKVGVNTKMRASKKPYPPLPEVGGEYYPLRGDNLNSLPYSFLSSKANNQYSKKKKPDFANTILNNAFIKPFTKLSTKVCYLSTKIHQQLYLKRMSLFMCKRLVSAAGFPATLPLAGYAKTIGRSLPPGGIPPLPPGGMGMGTVAEHKGPEVNYISVNSPRSTKLAHKLFDRVSNYYTDNRTPLKQNTKQIPIKSVTLYPHQVLFANLWPELNSTLVTKKVVTTDCLPPFRMHACGINPMGVKRDKINGSRKNIVLRASSSSFSKQAVLGSLLVRDSQDNAPTLRESSKKNYIPVKIQIYLAEKRKIQVGDKMAGRHGNKGIISQILPRQDMPYLPDGTAVDIVLNPLGVPSRMNVGQIYECLLGLAGKYLGQHFKIFPFDEIYGPEASRSFVYSKLHEARQKTGLKWLFNPNTPGKLRLFDGRTGDCFEQPITVGRAYMLKLVHMVDDKIHARSTGPYSLVTQQPLRGRSKQGGQRLGEMEVWAIEGYGAAFTLLEMLTIKSDDMTGRMTLWHNLIFNKEISIGTPESFKVLICELQALCLDIGLFKKQ